MSLNRFTPSSSVSIVYFKQENACWDDNDNNNDDNSRDEDVDRTGFTINSIFFLQIGGRESSTEE